MTLQVVAASDLIMVMETQQRLAMHDLFGRSWSDVVVLGDLDPKAVDTRSIADPLDQPADVFETSYARIDRCVQELAGALRVAAAQQMVG